MTANEFREARRELGLSVTELAIAMRTDRRAVERYESGERDVPGPVTRLIEGFLCGAIPIDER